MKSLPLLWIYLVFFSLSVQAQSSCIANPQSSYCCDPGVDVCIPRVTQVKYGVKAGDLCVSGYPGGDSCGAFIWRADFSSPQESVEWRKGLVAAYWNQAHISYPVIYELCSPVQANALVLAWSGAEKDLTLTNLQYQHWETIAPLKGAPSGGGVISCATPTPLPQSFDIYRYLIQSNCDAGFTPGLLITDDTPVCTKKFPLDISINGPSSTQALPSDIGPILQNISVLRNGSPAKNISVQIKLQEEGSSTVQNSSGVTDVNGIYRLLYVPPYLKSTSVNLAASCASCTAEAKKTIQVISNDLDDRPNMCNKNDF